MNPIVVIPTYWSTYGDIGAAGDVVLYDHTTAVTNNSPELVDCLDSLKDVQGLGKIVLLVVCRIEEEPFVEERIKKILDQFSMLDISVIAPRSSRHLSNALTQLTDDRISSDAVSLRGYGAIRNLGLAYAALYGHDVVIFLDDDEVVLDNDFIEKAVYGLGLSTRDGYDILIKSGYFLNSKDSPYAPSNARWYDKYWNKHDAFNEWMRSALSGERLSRSNILTGGCCVMHGEAFSKVPFDPWITRGEDFDYLINGKLLGLDTWFDNEWYVKHMPPQIPSSAPRFMQNVYRWHYQSEKIRLANTRINLQNISPKSFLPYPGPWLSPDIGKRARLTALGRAIGTEEKSEYIDIFLRGPRRAREYAENTAQNYLQLLACWSSYIQYIWENQELQNKIEQMDF